MTDDLKRALASVADAERPDGDATADLDRARRAQRRRTRRRLRLSLGGLAVATVLAVSVTVALENDSTPPAAAGVELVSERLEATPYTFDLTPTGWSVQAQNPYAVTIVPDDGSTSSNPDVFVGKLVIMFDANRPSGRVLDHDGRRFWVTGDSGYTTLATRTQDGEPAGVVRIQYPSGAGWDEPTMVAFLASVHVGPGARRGQG